MTLALTACGRMPESIATPTIDIPATSKADFEDDPGKATVTETKSAPKTRVTPKAMVVATTEPSPAAITEIPDLAVACTLDAKQLRISCKAIGFKIGSQLTWTSTASWAYSGGSQWQFTIHEELIATTAQVSLEECNGSSCQTVKTSIDTSILVSEDTSPQTFSPTPTKMPSHIPTEPSANTSTPAPNLEPRPTLILPFMIEHEPTGMMPMGETIQHAREAPWGHPGIDFQWLYKAPIVIALGGEVVQIITKDSKRHELTEYSVLVITGEFIVNYEVIELYSANPALEVGTPVAAGQMIGYSTPIGVGDGMHMTHWSFGTHTKNDDLNPNPEGIVMLYHTKYLCPVPYFSDSERQRLSQIWEGASYNERDQFPSLCNGPYKNY